MSIAPFSLVERDLAGRVVRVLPVQYIARHNLPTLTNARVARFGSRAA